jgi:hypothetical protein
MMRYALGAFSNCIMSDLRAFIYENNILKLKIELEIESHRVITKQDNHTYA